MANHIPAQLGSPVGYVQDKKWQPQLITAGVICLVAACLLYFGGNTEETVLIILFIVFGYLLAISAGIFFSIGVWRFTSQAVRSDNKWRRHSSWAIPFIIIILFVLFVLFVPYRKGEGLLGFLAAFALSAVLAVAVAAIPLIIFILIHAKNCFRMWRWDHGKLTKRERITAELAAQQSAVQKYFFSVATSLRESLIVQGERGEQFNFSQIASNEKVWEIVPWNGEVFLAKGEGMYSRYYGVDVSYGGSSTFAFGTPLFVSTMMAVDAFAQSSERKRAERMARAQWREYTHCQIVISNRRILCFVGGNWLTFPYSAMKAVYPNVKQAMLICQFSDGAAPLMLAGGVSLVASVTSVAVAFGLDHLKNHPELQHLNPSDDK